MAKNSLAMGMVQFISQLSTLVLAMVLSVKLVDDYPTYTSAFSVATVLFLIADLGLGTKMVIDVAQNRDIAGRKLSSILTIRGTLGTVAVILTLGFVLISDLVRCGLRVPGHSAIQSSGMDSSDVHLNVHRLREDALCLQGPTWWRGCSSPPPSP